MKTIKTKVYEFNELSDEAKIKAREWMRDATSNDNNFADGVIEDATTISILLGISDIKIGYSGFWSQGDGAHFAGRWAASELKIGKVAEYAPKDKELNRIAAEFERIAKLYPASSFSVKHSGHYQHQNCTDFSVKLLADEND